ncbi:MAG: hypothetical protein ACK4GN_13125 [Runella sp.]
MSISALIKYCFFLFCISQAAFAQPSTRFSMNFSGGKSLPLYRLATEVFGETNGELAGGGVAGQFLVAYYPSKRLGLAGRVSYNLNGTRPEGITNVAAKQYGVSNTVVELAKNWRSISAMIGPTLRLGGDRLGLEGRLLIGYAQVQSPSFRVTGVIQNVNVRVETDPSEASDWAYGAGATLSLGLTKNIALVANADATLINTVFIDVNNTITTISSSPRTTTVQTNIKQSVGILNLMGGLRFSF